MHAIRMAHAPLRYHSELPLVEVIANATALGSGQRTALQQQGAMFDDDCIASMSELNPWWGELTAVHWLLQQDLPEVVGNAQYRRSWSDQSLLTVEPDGLYLCHPCFFHCPLAEQFAGSHAFPGIEMTMELARQGKLPFTADEMSIVWQQNRFQGGPMAVGASKHYRKLMGVLFDCLWPIWDSYEGQLRQLSGYDQRAMAFLSERILSGIVLFPEKFLGNIPLRFIPLRYHEP
jgi:hypothetical protein